jgi:hypothetical protein
MCTAPHSLLLLPQFYSRSLRTGLQLKTAVTVLYLFAAPQYYSKGVAKPKYMLN